MPTSVILSYISERRQKQMQNQTYSSTIIAVVGHLEIAKEKPLDQSNQHTSLTGCITDQSNLLVVDAHFSKLIPITRSGFVFPSDAHGAVHTNQGFTVRLYTAMK